MNESKRRLALALATLGLMAASANAQDNAHSQSAPLLRPSGPMAWEMQIIVGDSPTPEVVHTIVRDDRISHVVATRSDGSTSTYWWFEHRLFHKYRGQIIINEIDLATTEPYPYASDRFYGIANVQAGDERGFAVFKGTRCRHYKGALPPHVERIGEIAPSTATVYEAWFHEKSGLPKAYRAGNITALFVFSDSVPSRLSLPRAYQSVWEDHLNALRRAGLAP